MMLLEQFGPGADAKILERVRVVAKGNEAARP